MNDDAMVAPLPTNGRRSGLAVSGLVFATALGAIAVAGGLAMLLTFAGVCGPGDDCDSWKRRQLPVAVGVGLVAALTTLVSGGIAVALGRRVAIQVVCAGVSMACMAVVLGLEVIYFTR